MNDYVALVAMAALLLSAGATALSLDAGLSGRWRALPLTPGGGPERPGGR